MKAPPLTLDRTSDLLARGEHCDAWVVTYREALGYEDYGFPHFAQRASGCHIWDVDQNEYIDYILGYGTVMLGHADQRVNEAVTQELALGTCVSPLWRPMQVQLNELLTSVIPHAELSYLLRTGSDATAAAIRFARLYTGRTKILQWGYHGWHDWSTPRPDGVPKSVRDQTLTFNYNDLSSVREAFERYADDIACVIMMPLELEPPTPGFLHGVRTIAHDYGALFILDEIRSGFRLSLGGAQQYFGIQADLVVIGKAMSNGHPISAVVGREDVMRSLGRTHLEGTYFGNSLEMAAAIATISILRDTDALEKVWRSGERFLSGLRQLSAEFEVQIDVVGLPPTPYLQFTEPDRHVCSQMKQAFFTETVRRGVLFEPGHHWFISASHQDEDIDRTLDACRHGFAAIKELELKSLG